MNFLTFAYWSNMRPDLLAPLAWKLFNALVVGCAALAIIVAVIKKKGLYRGFLKRLYGFFLSNAIIGLLLLFFNYEMVPFFSARFWLALWLIEMLVWLIFILRALKAIPTKKQDLDKEKELKKYLP